MDVLASLNPAQRRAVEATRGPVLVLAGPGSGKTRVIAHRAAYLIRILGIDPHRIMAVTFTNRAAREMRERLARLVSSSVARLTLGTFHAICARILRIEGKTLGISPGFVIYDADDQLSLVKKALNGLNLDPKQYPPQTIRNAISAVKSQIPPPGGSLERSHSYFDEVVKRVYGRYQELLSGSNALDFDDLLLKVVELFRKNREILAEYQVRYVHILVDEFQDTNTVQYELVKLLGGKYRNIFMVGDPDQSIYSWRFADLRNLLSFESDFPDAAVILLEQNYRSTKMILETASRVISLNKQMKPRKLWTENEPGERISVFDFYTEREEAQFVVSEVDKLISSARFKAGDIAVMYRTNVQSRVLEEAFIRYGMPYQLVAGARFYERREIKDLIAYFRLIQNPSDSVSLERIINVPGRGIGEKTVSQLTAWAKSLGVSTYQALKLLDEPVSDGAKKHPFTPHMAKGLVSFLHLANELIAGSRERDTVSLFDHILDRLGYREYLTGEPGGEERWENVRELRTVVREYESLSSEEGLTAFLEGVSLVSDVDGLKESPDAATLITLHQAKGLEFPVVFIVGVEDGLLPHIKSFDDPFQMEEERRLFYVGITRAKKKLYLLHAFRRSLMGMSGVGKPSRFLADIPKHLVSGGIGDGEGDQIKSSVYHWDRGEDGGIPRVPAEASLFHAGEHIRHPSFGEGVIVSLQSLKGDAEAVVAFKNGGVRKLLLSFARLERVE